MTWLDYAVLGVTALSIAWGLWRGLAREVVSLAGWVIAFLAANLFAAPLAEALPQSIPQPELRVIVAFVAIFVVALTLTTLAAVLQEKQPVVQQLIDGSAADDSQYSAHRIGLFPLCNSQ